MDNSNFVSCLSDWYKIGLKRRGQIIGKEDIPHDLFFHNWLRGIVLPGYNVLRFSDAKNAWTIYGLMSYYGLNPKMGESIWIPSTFSHVISFDQPDFSYMLEYWI